MDRLKLAALGERLKTGGAQMSRKVSGKWKEFLQVQTHEAKMVEEATSESLSEPNWGLNLRICGLLNCEEFSGPEVMRAIKKKIAGKSMVSQRFSLDLLEACAMNCDKVFSEIASEKVLEEMVRLVDNPQTHFSNKERALQLIRAWGESTDLGYLPVFHQTYLNLQARGVSFSTQDTMNLASLMESNVYQEPLSLPEGYPNSHMDMPNADQIPFAYYQSLTLSAEGKKEALEVARNSIELLSSMLNPVTQEKPVKDDLTLSLLEKCKQSQSVIQRIVESTTDDEGLLFEALNIHENLQQILSKYEEPDAVPQLSGHPMEGLETASGSSGHDYVEKMEKLNSPPKSEKSGTSNGQENAG